MKRDFLVCVDDEEDILRSLARTLRGEPYEVVTFVSPTEALAFVREHQPAVVMTDFRMPTMNGGDFLRSVADAAPSSVRVVLSGYAEENFVIGLREEGKIHAFLSKPWEPRELRARLRECFELRREKTLVGK